MYTIITQDVWESLVLNVMQMYLKMYYHCDDGFDLSQSKKQSYYPCQ